MTDAIVVAVLSLIGTLGGSLGGILTANKMTNYRLEQLEKRVTEHNRLIDRTYSLEAHRDVVDEEIKVINHRVEDLEQYHK